MKKRDHNIEDYILLALPENPRIFGVERKAQGTERFIKVDPTGTLLGPVYNTIIHIISPYYNFYTGEPTECCNCLSWRARRKRCIHLKKFYHMNPQQDPRLTKETDVFYDIYEDTCLHAGVLADKAAGYFPNEDYQGLSQLLEIKTEKEFRENPEFREKLNSCTNKDKKIKVENEISSEQARDWLIEEMKVWAKEIIGNKRNER